MYIYIYIKFSRYEGQNCTLHAIHDFFLKKNRYASLAPGPRSRQCLTPWGSVHRQVPAQLIAGSDVTSPEKNGSLYTIGQAKKEDPASRRQESGCKNQSTATWSELRHHASAGAGEATWSAWSFCCWIPLAVFAPTVGPHPMRGPPSRSTVGTWVGLVRPGWVTTVHE